MSFPMRSENIFLGPPNHSIDLRIAFWVEIGDEPKPYAVNLKPSPPHWMPLLADLAWDSVFRV